MSDQSILKYLIISHSKDVQTLAISLNRTAATVEHYKRYDSSFDFVTEMLSQRRQYIMVQLTVHVSVWGLPVLIIIYKIIIIHKRTKSQNCEFCVL